MTLPASPPATPVVPLYPPLGSPTFNQDSYAYGAAMPGVAVALGALAQNTAYNSGIAYESASAAAQSELTALTAAAAASAAAGATKWVDRTYGEGDVVWSPMNGFLYRRKSPGSGLIDPSADAANWWLIGTPLAAPIQPISANATAVAGMHYLIMAPLTLLLPPAPAVRDTVRFTDFTGLTATVIDPNGALIRGVAGAMNLNSINADRTLTYSGSTKGWV